jgi:endonuclease YncB( thermonuclease family)
MARPSIGPARSVRCSEEEWARVDRLAELTATNGSDMARRLIVRGLEAVAADAKPKPRTGKRGRS